MKINNKIRKKILNMRKQGKSWKAIAIETNINPKTCRDICKEFGVDTIIKKCAKCGRFFKTDEIQKKYCSLKCLYQRTEERKQKIKIKFKRKCVRCGKKFTTFKNNQMYCSQNCFKIGLRVKKCVYCGNEFISPIRKYCSIECNRRANSIKTKKYWAIMRNLLRKRIKTANKNIQLLNEKKQMLEWLLLKNPIPISKWREQKWKKELNDINKKLAIWGERKLGWIDLNLKGGENGGRGFKG